MTAKNHRKFSRMVLPEEKNAFPKSRAGSTFGRWIRGSGCHLPPLVVATLVCGALVLPHGLARAQAIPKISVDCTNIPVKECVQQLPLVVTVDASMATQKVRVQFKEMTPSEGLGRIMDAAGVTNYVILFDKTGNHATISSFTAGSGEGAVTTQPKLVTAADTSKAAEQAQQSAKPPTAKSLEALVKNLKDPPPLSPDSVLHFPGGAEITVRDLQAAQEQAAVSTASPEQPIALSVGEKPLTLGDLKKMQEQANKPIYTPKVTFPNGATLSVEDVKGIPTQSQGKTSSGNGIPKTIKLPPGMLGAETTPAKPATP